MLKRKLYKKWAICFLSIFVTVTASVVAINYAVDPMWCFNHETPFAEWREFIDERIQKTNLLRYRNFTIDTLIIGTSRSLGISPDTFGPNGMNFALTGCMAFEYTYIIETFYQARGYYPTKIIIGIDFFSSASKYSDESPGNKMQEIYNDIKTDKRLERLETVSNINLFKKSINLIIDNIKGNVPQNAGIKYTQGYMDARAFYLPIDNMKTKVRAVKSNVNYYRGIYSRYQYSNQYKSDINSLVQLPQSTELTVFISPIGTPLLQLLAEIPGMMDNYEKFLRETVDVFGGVWNFMYVNSVTQNHIYWREPSHHLSIIDKWMTARIIGNGDCPDDFGIYITKQNIDDHINTIKMDILNLRNINDTWHIFFDEEYVAENG